MRGIHPGTHLQFYSMLMSLAPIRVVRLGTDLLRLIILYMHTSRGTVCVYSMLGPYYPHFTPEIVDTIWV